MLTNRLASYGFEIARRDPTLYECATHSYSLLLHLLSNIKTSKSTISRFFYIIILHTAAYGVVPCDYRCGLRPNIFPSLSLGNFTRPIIIGNLYVKNILVSSLNVQINLLISYFRYITPIYYIQTSKFLFSTNMHLVSI